jgi:hypothetical protein
LRPYHPMASTSRRRHFWRLPAASYAARRRETPRRVRTCVRSDDDDRSVRAAAGRRQDGVTGKARASATSKPSAWLGAVSMRCTPRPARACPSGARPLAAAALQNR